MNPLAVTEVALKFRELKEKAKEEYIEQSLGSYSKSSNQYKKWKKGVKDKLTEIFNYAENNKIPYKVTVEDFCTEIVDSIQVAVEDEYYQEYSEEISNDYDE